MTKEDMLSIYGMTKQPCLPNLCKFIYSKLEELQHFIGNTFPKYFDQDVQVAEVYRLMAARELEEKMTPLKAALMTKGMDEELIIIAFAPVAQLIEPMAGQELTYRKVTYLKGLIRMMENISRPEYRLRYGPTIDLIRLMYYMNFNAYSFFDYCKEYVQKEADGRSITTRATRYFSMSLILVRRMSLTRPCRPRRKG